MDALVIALVVAVVDVWDAQELAQVDVSISVVMVVLRVVKELVVRLAMVTVMQ